MRDTDREVKVVANSVGDIDGFGYVAGGKEAATALYQMGADIIFAAAADSTLGVVEAAWEQSQATGMHRWAIGVDSDWWTATPDHMRPHFLTSATKGYDQAIGPPLRGRAICTRGDFAGPWVGRSAQPVGIGAE